MLAFAYLHTRDRAGRVGVDLQHATVSANVDFALLSTRAQRLDQRWADWATVPRTVKAVGAGAAAARDSTQVGAERYHPVGGGGGFFRQDFDKGRIAAIL